METVEEGAKLGYVVSALRVAHFFASLQKLIEQGKENNKAANHVVTELVPLWRVCTVCMRSQSGPNLGTPAMIGTSRPTFFPRLGRYPIS